MHELLKVSSVGKQFRSGGKDLQVLSSISLSVSAGDRIAIIGKSGAGKSTLLHILGALESPSTGTVHFEGKEIFKLSEKEISQFRNQRLGFVFQFHYLMLEFDAIENVMMPALIRGTDRKEARDRAATLLGRVGLAGRHQHKPNQLSGGEQQRVAIARALMNRPTLLLTDEMTGNLDPVTGRQVFELVQELHAENQMAMISVTHDENLAGKYPRVYQLEAGGLVPA